MSRENSRKLAIFIPDLAGGGAQRVNVRLANELSRQGVDVDVVVNDADGPFRSLVADNVRVVTFGHRKFETTLLSLCRYVVRERPDVVIAAMQHAGVIALLAKKFVGKQCCFVVQYHSTISAEYSAARPMARLWLRLLGVLLPSADAVVAISNGVAEDIVDTFPKTSHNVSTIYNPAFGPDIVELADESVAHAWFDDPEAPVIVSVGRLAPPKDYETLLDAFSIVRRSRRARLVIVGEGPDMNKIVARAKELGVVDLVDFLGFRSNPYPFMKNAGVFVLSSSYEGMPLVLVEALACGAPVVCTACCSGCLEVLGDGKWGRLVPVGDSRAMAGAILKALDQPVDSRALLARAQRFSARSVAQEYLEFLFPKNHEPMSTA